MELDKAYSFRLNNEDKLVIDKCPICNGIFYRFSYNPNDFSKNTEIQGISTICVNNHTISNGLKLIYYN